MTGEIAEAKREASEKLISAPKIGKQRPIVWR
jgi:hypothetical protein